MSTSIFARPGQFALTLCLLATPLACGDDKGGDTDAATEATTTQTTPATTTQTPTEAGTDTDAPTTTMDPTAGPSGLFCQEECTEDADCTLAGMDMGYTCKDGRCAGDAPVGGCTDDSECKALFSGWVTDCTDQAGCPGQVCVDTGDGAGKCATPPSDFFMCSQAFLDELDLMTIEGDMTVTVCGNSTATCNDSVCVDPCTADTDCTSPASPVCNTGTGLCECSADDQCAGAGVPGLAVCNNGVCGCGDDADCADSPTADTCYEGLCGCSGVDACTSAMAFDGTTKVCEGF